MAGTEEIDRSGTAVRGNEWEVVSLTESAYAAASGPKAIEQDIEDKSNVSAELEGESSHALFISRHFAYPAKENLSSEAEKSLIQKTDKDKYLLCELVEEGDKSDMKVENDHSLKGLNLSQKLPDLRLCDGEIDKHSSPELETTRSLLELNKVEKEEILYGEAVYGSFHEDAPVDDKIPTSDLSESLEQDSDVDVNVNASDVYTENEKNPDKSNLPCKAWWKRQAAFLYDRAKETNTLWSIFIAAAVMGLVFLGHRWQKERRQILLVKWHVAGKEEKSGRVLQPSSLLRNVIVGGSRANSFMQGAHYEL